MRGMVSRFKCTTFFSVVVSSALTSLPALAQFPVLQTTFENVSGTEISVSAVTLYGSITGRSYASCTNDVPCNTCQDQAGQILRPCNVAAIAPNTILKITFPATVAGVLRVMHDNTTTALGGFTPTNVLAGSPAVIQIPWSELCNYVNAGDSACAVNGSKSIIIGIDPFVNGVAVGNLTNAAVKQTIAIQVVSSGLCTNNDSGSCNGGIYKFDVRAGDQKAYLRNLTSENASFPVISGPSGGVTVAKLRAYYVPATSNDLLGANSCATDAQLIRNGSPHVDIEISKPNDVIELSDDAIKSLSNLKKYVFKLAMVDKAGNVSYFTQDSECGDLIGPDAGRRAVAAVNGNHVVIPDEVTGLLSGGNNCFIATAAYGSSLDPRVQTFRDLRDRFLLTSSVGQKFVGFYYKHSPPLADFIGRSEILKTLVRWILWPLWALSSLLMSFGYILTIMFLTSALLVFWGIGFFIRGVGVYRNQRALENLKSSPEPLRPTSKENVPEGFSL